MSRGPLQRRLTIALIALGAVLALTYGVVLPQVAFKVEDRVFLRLTARAAAAFASDPSAPLPDGIAVRFDRHGASPGADPLDALLAGLDDGIHELNDVSSDGGDTDLFVARGRLADGRRYALVHDVRPIEAFDEAIDTDGLLAVLVLGLVVGVLGTAVAFVGVGSVFRRLGRVRDAVAEPDLERAAAAIGALPRDEVGDIARRGLEARRELAAALDRERRFTRDASHELRTPAAIVHGAVELLDRELPADSPARRLVRRIDTANRRIEELVVMFLGLARHAATAGADHAQDLAATVQRVRRDLTAAGVGGDERIVVDDLGAAPVLASAPLLEVVVRNLVHNALTHGSGTVRVRIADRGLEVVNAVAVESPAEPGFGLSLVAELCARHGWRWQRDIAAGLHRAQVRFDSTNR